MKKKSTIFLNSAMGLTNQVVTMLFAFLTRTLFIRYFGVDVLGLNSTFASVLGTLSLAELGFESAIVFSLYKPLHDGDQTQVNDIMNVFRLVYRGVGLFFVAASVAVLPFLRFILKDVQITADVYYYFLLQAAASACTYFLAYKRALIYADRRDYVTKTLDLTVNVVFSLLQCWAIIASRNYYLYLTLKIVQTYGANFIVHRYCKKAYPYLHAAKLNKAKFQEIMSHVKNVFTSRMAAYVYQSTDNLVISAFVGTVSVGYFANYTTVTKSLKSVTLSVLGPIMPVIGNFLVEDDTPQGREGVFLLYTHVRYLIAAFIVIPLVVLIDDFIVMWVGQDMLLPRIVAILLAVEYYIDLVHTSTVDFIDAAGLFQYSKNIAIAGALTNLIFSLILVQFWGIIGVLMGTILSQLVFWIGRSIIAYSKCLKCPWKHFARYWVRNLAYIVVFVVGFVLCRQLYQHLPISSTVVRFLAGGVLCETVLLVVIMLCFSGLKEQRQILTLAKSKLVRSRK